MKTHAPPHSAPLKTATPGTEAARTLAIDIGGTGLKMAVLGPQGKVAVERIRVETPHPATPRAVLAVLWGMMDAMGSFERVSVGFPGVVIDGVIQTAPNLHPKWEGFPLSKVLSESVRRPVRVLNDAGVQGYGVVEGKGVELLITLGTGMGCALFMDGVYVPNLELAHHPFRNGKSYEDYVGGKAFETLPRKQWNRRVSRVVEQILPVFNPRYLYIGGGNAKHVDVKLPEHVKLVANVAGLLGGIALWRHP